MKQIVSAFLLISAAGAAAPAFAQATPQATPSTSAPTTPAVAAKAGDTIYDPAGGVIGTIESVAGGNAVISTGTNKATVAISAFASGPKGPVIGMTKAQLDAAIQNAGQGSGQSPAQSSDQAPGK